MILNKRSFIGMLLALVPIAAVSSLREAPKEKQTAIPDKEVEYDYRWVRPEQVEQFRAKGWVPVGEQPILSPLGDVTYISRKKALNNSI